MFYRDLLLGPFFFFWNAPPTDRHTLLWLFLGGAGELEGVGLFCDVLFDSTMCGRSGRGG